MKVLGFEILSEPSIADQLPEFIDVATLAGGISVFVPLVVSLVTKREASDRVKAIAQLLSVAVASVVALVVNNKGDAITWQTIAATFVTGLVTSMVAYKAGWKPIGVTRGIERATENFGVGQPVTPQAEITRLG